MTNEKKRILTNRGGKFRTLFITLKNSPGKKIISEKQT